MKINELIQKIKLQCTYIDRVYWLLFGLLIIVAILSLFSASSTLAFAGDSTLNPILNQMLFIVVGVGLAFGIQFVPRSWIRNGGYIGLIVSIVLLILTYTSMGVEINDHGNTFFLRLLTVYHVSPCGIIVAVDNLSGFKYNATIACPAS